jgi:hypothetical protein
MQKKKLEAAPAKSKAIGAPKKTSTSEKPQGKAEGQSKADNKPKPKASAPMK